MGYDDTITVKQCNYILGLCERLGIDDDEAVWRVIQLRKPRHECTRIEGTMVIDYLKNECVRLGA